MRNNNSHIARNAISVGLLAACLALAPAEARADFIDFTVVESAVPGSEGFPNITVDKLNGGYEEILTLGPGNTFTAVADATFTAYWLDGTPIIGTALSTFPAPGAYLIYADFSASGTYVDNPDCNPDPMVVTPCRIFTALLGESTLFVDPDQIRGNADDLLLVSSSNLLPGSGGQLITSTVPPTGNFNFVFGTNDLSSPFGEAYWPDLANIVFTTTVNGDFDSVSGDNPQTITGDVSVQVTAVTPEPATLALFGMALFGSGLVARRRRKV